MKLHRRIARAFGYDLVKAAKYQATLETHLHFLLEKLRVDCVLDVGANNGQYAQTLRAAGYSGHIVSFEPVPSCIDTLQRLARHDERWSVQPFALGREQSRLELSIPHGSRFASFRAVSEYGAARYPESMSLQTTLSVPVKRLDSVLREVSPHHGARCFLKLDTQGFDLEVFGGAAGCMDALVGLQSEMSVLPIYEAVPDYQEALAAYRRAGFEVTGFFPVSREQERLVLVEFDCVMARIRLGDTAPKEK